MYDLSVGMENFWCFCREFGCVHFLLNNYACVTRQLLEINPIVLSVAFCLHLQDDAMQGVRGDYSE